MNSIENVRRFAGILWLILVSLVAIFSPAKSGGQIFVANEGNGTVGEYTLSGAPINPTLISGLNAPEGLAYADGNLFVVTQSGIGEYTTSGAPINPTLITDGLDQPVGIAISGDNIFVTNWGPSGLGWIGEYTTSGDTVNAQLISDLGHLRLPTGITIDGDQLFVSGYPGYVGLYSTSGAVINQQLIYNQNGITDPAALAITGGNLFIAALGPNHGSIWNYTTSGVLASFNVITAGLDGPWGMVERNDNLFVANSYSGTVSEYTTDQAIINLSLISGLDNPVGIVVIPEPSSIALLAIGALGLAAMARRRVGK